VRRFISNLSPPPFVCEISFNSPGDYTTPRSPNLNVSLGPTFLLSSCTMYFLLSVTSMVLRTFFRWCFLRFLSRSLRLICAVAPVPSPFYASAFPPFLGMVLCGPWHPPPLFEGLTPLPLFSFFYNFCFSPITITLFFFFSKLHWREALTISCTC